MKTRRWLILLACATLGLSAAGCEDKVAKCQKTCTELDKEYMAKCTGEGAQACTDATAKTTTSCNKLCEEAMK